MRPGDLVITRNHIPVIASPLGLVPAGTLGILLEVVSREWEHCAIVLISGHRVEFNRSRLEVINDPS